MQQYIITYYDTKTQMNSYKTCNDPGYIKNIGGEMTFDSQKYALDNPDICIKGIYNASDNILWKNELQKEQFELNCGVYGFNQDDYRKVIHDNRDEEDYLFLGFLPSNTKYKALLLNIRTGLRTKATLKFVRLNMTDKIID